MPLPWPEIRDKAIAFSREWQDAESERAEAQTFWNEFFAVFGVLDARLQFPDSSLADLYDPDTMPQALMKAHQILDHAVDAAYGKKSFASDAERVAFLFDLYEKYTSLLPSQSKAKKAARKRKSP